MFNIRYYLHNFPTSNSSGIFCDLNKVKEVSRKAFKYNFLVQYFCLLAVYLLLLSLTFLVLIIYSTHNITIHRNSVLLTVVAVLEEFRAGEFSFSSTRDRTESKVITPFGSQSSCILSNNCNNQ